jgi:hypothetical protein
MITKSRKWNSFQPQTAPLPCEEMHLQSFDCFVSKQISRYSRMELNGNSNNRFTLSLSTHSRSWWIAGTSKQFHETSYLFLNWDEHSSPLCMERWLDLRGSRDIILSNVGHLSNRYHEFAFLAICQSAKIHVQVNLAGWRQYWPLPTEDSWTSIRLLFLFLFRILLRIIWDLLFTVFVRFCWSWQIACKFTLWLSHRTSAR